jgi:endonuclease III
METNKKISIINKLLLRKYGLPPRNLTLPDPVDLLIATILSQNTNDNNSYRAYQNLKKKFKTWEEVSSARRTDIEKEIKIAGLGLQKSRAIKNFFIGIKEKRDEISLEYLKQLSNEEALSDLTSYNGIGVKTASCVLLFALNRNVCPVDTHVHRITNRIGLVKTTSPDKTFFSLNKNFPVKIAHQFHTNLIRHGREICKAQKPICKICPIVPICMFEQKDFSLKALNRKGNFMLLDNVGNT